MVMMMRMTMMMTDRQDIGYVAHTVPCSVQMVTQ